jgi:hypothetical protein
VRAGIIAGVLGTAAVAHAYFLNPKILAKWNALGGAAGPLGDVTSSSHDDGAGGLISSFRWGWIDYVAANVNAYPAYGLIGAAWWNRYGGPAGIGHPVNDERDQGVGGRISFFQHGDWRGPITSLVWNPDRFLPCTQHSDNVCAIYGRIREVWQMKNLNPGFPDSNLDIGLPTEEEHDDWSQPDVYRVQGFQKMYITWNKQTYTSCIYTNDGSRLQWGDGQCASLP